MRWLGYFREFFQFLGDEIITARTYLLASKPSFVFQHRLQDLCLLGLGLLYSFKRSPFEFGSKSLVKCLLFEYPILCIMRFFSWKFVFSVKQKHVSVVFLTHGLQVWEVSLVFYHCVDVTTESACEVFLLHFHADVLLLKEFP